ncbi:MAG TPA: carbohydrate kinase family protein [Candidatus Saccharimonadales bacterium]|jgi:ribokinase|nr:carbohydrate kinase family protein [Candidatus Saccharimonadales bacterium]
MAKFLQDLLQAEEPLFTTALRQLERATGHSGLDVRLISDIITRAHRVMRKIGLDPSDTTADELYHSLASQVGNQALFADTEFVGLSFNGQVISFNFDDVRESVGRPLGRGATGHMQFCLRRELVTRYSDHERTNEQTVRQFVQDAGLPGLWYNQANDQQTQTDIKEENMEQPYILAIGDIFTDAFIKLREDKARIDTDPDGSKRLSLPFGSKPPYDSVEIVQAVGPSPNAAVAFSRLGLNAGLMAFLGDDQPGKDSLQYLSQEGVDTSTMMAHEGMKSNYYYVLRYGADRTILVKNEEYDYSWIAPEKTPDWIYLSLISEASWQLHEDLLAYLNEHPDTKFAFQPGTFHFEWGAEKLAKIYAHSYIVVMNREEAVDVTGKSYDSLKDLSDGLHALGPKIVVITDGPNGSYASYDGKLVTIPNYPDPAAPVDRTGAGDAFASTIVAALALGESIETALTWAPINSMNVVQHLGAQAGLLKREDIDQFLASAPDDYRAKEIN